MRLSCGYESKKARVEMLPLIDVVFLLLVFFIYAMLSMVVHHGLKVELPSAGTATLDRNECIEITIDNANTIFLGRNPVGLDELPSRILALQGTNEKPVFIDGDEAADLGLAIRLLDRLKHAGIEKVSFSCKPRDP
jgi:biopolymer transport protein ExbD